MMSLVLFFTVCLLCMCGTVIASHEPDVDSNRIHLLPQANSYSSSSNSHERPHSVYETQQFRTNDYDDYSSGYNRLPQSMQRRVPPLERKTSVKVHQPKEDPRLFYQSDAYLEEINGRHVNQEVTFVYPGREVIRATEGSDIKSMALRLQDVKTIDNGFSICVKCPHDRTLIAKAGSDRVLLQSPRLLTCSGYEAPKNINFIHMYGPQFGSLLQEGSHLIIGKIMLGDKNLNYCKMQVHVVTQGCATPEYLKSNCVDQNCTFTCRNLNSDLHGQSSLQCGSNKKWIGTLPVCKARAWCLAPAAPDRGRVRCKGATVAGRGLAEGARCRLRCPRGWRWQPRDAAVCRRGSWTHSLVCQRTV